MCISKLLCAAYLMRHVWDITRSQKSEHKRSVIPLHSLPLLVTAVVNDHSLSCLRLKRILIV